MTNEVGCAPVGGVIGCCPIYFGGPGIYLTISPRIGFAGTAAVQNRVAIRRAAAAVVIPRVQGAAGKDRSATWPDRDRRTVVGAAAPPSWTGPSSKYCAVADNAPPASRSVPS